MQRLIYMMLFIPHIPSNHKKIPIYRFIVTYVSLHLVLYPEQNEQASLEQSVDQLYMFDMKWRGSHPTVSAKPKKDRQGRFFLFI